MDSLQLLPTTPDGSTPAPATDDDLARLAAGGDPDAFEVLVRRHNRRVYRTVRAVLRDEDEAEDAAQEAWVRAWSSLGGWSGTGFPAWLVRVAVNEALGRLRARRRWRGAGEGVLDTLPALAPSAEARAASRETLAAVEAVIEALPTSWRVAFVLRELEQLSTADVAATLGVSEEAVRLRLMRARRALRLAVGDEGVAAAGGAWAFAGERCDRMTHAVMARVRATVSPDEPTPPRG